MVFHTVKTFIEYAVRVLGLQNENHTNRLGVSKRFPFYIKRIPHPVRGRSAISHAKKRRVHSSLLAYFHIYSLLKVPVPA